MVDRDARDRIGSALENYTNDLFTNDELDDIIWDTYHSTQDSIARESVRAIWCMYDEVRTHKVEATKEAWDYLERLRLLLASDVDSISNSGRSNTRKDAALAPFTSVSELLRVRKRVTGFAKQPYRPELLELRATNLREYQRASLLYLLLAAVVFAVKYFLFS